MNTGTRTIEETEALNAASKQVHKVLYDSQCEVCQAGVSWLRMLGKHDRVDCIPISDEALSQIGGSLSMEACLHELHVLDPEGRLYVGWDAISQLARVFPSTWLIGTLGAIPPFRWIGRTLYRFVARNRYSLSKCRGGACRVAKPEAVRKVATLGVFWSCYTFGLFVRTPLILWAAFRSAISRFTVFCTTHNRQANYLGGKLTVLFLNGFGPNVVPLLFGELFTTIIYDGVAVDPGSPKMRRSLERHLRHMGTSGIRSIVATHAHEEHVGNLNWLSERTGAPVYVSKETAGQLLAPPKLPWVRAVIIGQPPPLHQPFQFLDDFLLTATGRLEVIATPGHCDDHIVLYDPKEKLLLAGDSFMGSYFSTPNPDVDSRKWLDTLEHLSKLDIEILIEGHGHIHTLRSDISAMPGVVIRRDPKKEINEKMLYLRWLREQVEAGLADGLPACAIEATCFPWGQRSAWESFANDKMISMLSLGHFSRIEVVRSFVRNPKDVLPVVYQARIYSDPAKNDSAT